MSLAAVTVSYGIGALAFAIPALLIVLQRSARPEAPPLALPMAVSALWLLAVSLQQPLGLGPGLVVLSELARNAVWFGFLARGLRRLRPDVELSPWLRQILLGVVLLIALSLTTQLAYLVAPGPRLAYVGLIVLPTLMAVAGMVLVEQFYRNARVQDRWGIKFLCLGLGGMYAYDFYLYAEGMLFGEPSAIAWAARGLVHALAAPLIWLSYGRLTQFLPVAISHRMVFHTITLVGAGVYLLLMAAAGYYIRVFGGEWGELLQYAFLFGAGVLLMVVVFSGAARARLRVFLSKHFFRYRYDYREEWLRFTRLLTSGEPGQQVCERSIEAIARLVDSPAGVLWLRREDGTFHRAAYWNWSDLSGSLPADAPLVRFLEQRQWVINLDEYRSDPSSLADVELPDWIAQNPRAWLLIPMLWHDRLLGFMVLEHSLGKLRFDWEVSDLLKTAARQAATNLAQMQAAEALTVARQFESFNRAAAFVVHDIKNLVAQLTLLLANAQKHRHNPEFQDDMLATIESSVARMNRMLAKLSNRSEHATSGEVELAGLLQEVVASKRGYGLKPRLHLAHTGLHVRADRERLARVLGHLVQNAIEATPYTGRVDVKLSRDQHHAVIEVEDTGTGMDAAFIRDKLFRPFVSTKGTGMGVGTYECKTYIEELGGDIGVTSAPGQGSRFTVRLPLVSQQVQEAA
ncbi:MAG: PEP-CTERM system histidine kinase PrsK [Thiobacillaceae bacterium]|nr:PEP-CTERM system histidine kinase PrsK [Thiobacillaceae bacterium]MDW8323372.1 PEP-CTERM system histidine kinase PrsK [Burkholderiales bacterium]